MANGYDMNQAQRMRRGFLGTGPHGNSANRNEPIRPLMQPISSNTLLPTSEQQSSAARHTFEQGFRGGAGRHRRNSNNKYHYASNESQIGKSNRTDNRRHSINFDNNTSASNSGHPNRQADSQRKFRISYDILNQLQTKEPNEIIAQLLNNNFQLKSVLNDNRMKTNFGWIKIMTKIFERAVLSRESRERLSMILGQIPHTSYVDGVYGYVGTPDRNTNQLPYDFIESFLKVMNKILAFIPSSAMELTKVIERIELQFMKVEIKSPEYEAAMVILNGVLDLQKEIQNRGHRSARSNQKDRPDMPLNYPPPPNNYRHLPIVPDMNEILSEERTYLRRNIVNGTYESPEHYLDVHFRLLREDFVGPLREGIQQHLSSNDGKNFNVRIYHNVHSYGPQLSKKSGIVYQLRLDHQMVSKISWANSRRLIYGNLLLLTYNNFQSHIFATVEDRSDIEKHAIVSVKPLERINNDTSEFQLDAIDFTYELTMIETMTYFEAYRPVLNALQSITIDENIFPLGRSLLNLNDKAIPPDYVTEQTTYDFTPLLVSPNSEVRVQFVYRSVPQMQNHRLHPHRPVETEMFSIQYTESNRVSAKYKNVKLLNENSWPTFDELHLNPKQREALFLALTNKIALIQGPPGTGKTYLGVRIAEMLLYNRSVWCPLHEQTTPILMICNTNHALDQFLELIVKRLKMNEGIIRVGNRSKNAVIQPFSLVNARRSARESRSIPRDIYHQKHAISDRKTAAEETLKFHQHKIERSRVEITPLEIFIENYVINDDHLNTLITPYNNQIDTKALFDWLGLFGHENIPADIFDQAADVTTEMAEKNIDDRNEENSDIDQNHNDTNNVPNEENNREVSDDEMDEEQEEEERRRSELDPEVESFAPSAILRPQVYTDQQAPSNENDEEGGWQIVAKKLNIRRRQIENILGYPTTLTDTDVLQMECDVWKLPMTQRYNLYRYWLLKYQQYLHDSVRSSREEYNQAMAALAEYHKEEDYYILKNSVIVAMTTTCAARYHDVLERLQSKIVIVEEAAAIFEAHIITALSTKCEHLILIGDHVQLRPNPSVYKLGVSYKIDVSLFERLIQNNFPNVRLNIQHRMRPEIARLLRHFYDDLQDHESVETEKNRPSIRGTGNNLFFIDHNHIETTVTDGSSKRNEFEGNYAIALAQYLIKQGYQTDQITILVMYLGQKQYIAKEARRFKSLHGLHITVTDNYQGEESDIIILSLVRSNSDNKIGFLKTHNRVCVALSRARCGLFILGNMKLLSSAEPLWRNIYKSLLDNKIIGEGLNLFCLQHSKEQFIANTAESFGQRPEGGCNKPCDTRLKCGHQCELMCHNYDQEHKNITCRKKCNADLPCGHKCTKRCHNETPNQHDPCRILVNKLITPCGHTIRFQCARTPTSADCRHPIPKLLPCNHLADVPCCITSSPFELSRFTCRKPCGQVLACKHKCAGTCGDCRTGRLHIPCKQKCERLLICSHVCKSPCGDNCPPCTVQCQTRCTHSRCNHLCGKLCTPCKEPCGYKCKHDKCTRNCSEPCDREPCNEPCDKKLKCGHDCIGICGEPCPRQCRICNKHIVQEIIFGTEDEQNARFVFLPDCLHIVEVTALDRFVNETVNDETGNTALRFPECPRCKQPIRRCKRYMPYINKVNQRISDVKRKILGNQTEEEMDQEHRQTRDKFENLIQTFRALDKEIIKRNFHNLFYETKLLSNDILILMRNTMLFLDEINKIMQVAKNKLKTNAFENVETLLNHMIKYLSENSQYRNLSEQQINDIQQELKRIRRLIFSEALLDSISQSTIPHLKVDDERNLKTMQCLIKKTGPFTIDDEKQFDGLMKSLQHLNNLPGLGINEKERIGIVSALNMSRGHWFVCPKGHPYIITECGGASQISNCPECGEKIGGENHQLLSNNRHFGLMDNSTHAAWSDEANLQLPPPNEF